VLKPEAGKGGERRCDRIQAIASGQLQVGEQLPTVRSLAVGLSINPNTISRAYRELEIKNILETQQGTGTFIGTTEVKIPEEERRAKLKSICDEFLTIAGSYGFTVEDVIEELRRRSGGR